MEREIKSLAPHCPNRSLMDILTFDRRACLLIFLVEVGVVVGVAVGGVDGCMT